MQAVLQAAFRTAKNKYDSHFGLGLRNAAWLMPDALSVYEVHLWRHV